MDYTRHLFPLCEVSQNKASFINSPSLQLWMVKVISSTDTENNKPYTSFAERHIIEHSVLRLR